MAAIAIAIAIDDWGLRLLNAANVPHPFILMTNRAAMTADLAHVDRANEKGHEWR